MELLSPKIIKTKLNEGKNKKDLNDKKLEGELRIELEGMLAEYLKDNDRILIEINDKVVGVFLNILNSKLEILYDYTQVDKNKFIFSNKELNF